MGVFFVLVKTIYYSNIKEIIKHVTEELKIFVLVEETLCLHQPL